MPHQKPSVAVIGAGISGITCAKLLQENGLKVKLFEKGRGVGGRMSTRRTKNELQFDHGAQYFTARDPSFSRCVNNWQEKDIVDLWQGRVLVIKDGEILDEKQGTARYVGTPSMNAVCRYLSKNISIQFNTLISAPHKVDEQWQLTDEEGNVQGEFDIVIISAPAVQSVGLLKSAPILAKQAFDAKMAGCWAMMVAFEKSLKIPFEAAFVHGSILSWIARNDSKPKRNRSIETWVLHASSDWSTYNIESSSSYVKKSMLEAFWAAIGITSKNVLHSKAHRWRYALPTNSLTERSLYDVKLKIGACGDWCGGPRVEGAFLSGVDVAQRILETAGFTIRTDYLQLP